MFASRGVLKEDEKIQNINQSRFQLTMMNTTNMSCKNICNSTGLRLNIFFCSKSLFSFGINNKIWFRTMPSLFFFLYTFFLSVLPIEKTNFLAERKYGRDCFFKFFYLKIYQNNIFFIF
jgi:hypothetical protein